jgi:hypothetical protein
MSDSMELDALDRATLIAWRVGNLVKWSAAALSVGFATTTAFYLAMRPLPSFSIRAGEPVGEALIALMFTLPAVLSAIGIGVVVGRHVYAWPFAIAALVAAAHLVAGWLLALAGWMLAPVGTYLMFSFNAMPAFAMALLEIYVAAVVARRSWNKRPRALRRFPRPQSRSAPEAGLLS